MSVTVENNLPLADQSTSGNTLTDDSANSQNTSLNQQTNDVSTSNPLISTPLQQALAAEGMGSQGTINVIDDRTSDNLVLDLTHHFTPFNIPNLEEIIAQVTRAFPEDPGITLQQSRFRGSGLYRLTISSPITASAASNITIKFDRKDKEGIDTILEVPLRLDVAPQFRSGRSARKPGTLVTILNARDGAARVIPNSTFDEV